MNEAKEKDVLVNKALDELEKRFNRTVGLSSSNLCVRCGICMDSCHYVQGDNDDPSITPAAKAERIRRVYKKKHDWLSKIFPWWTGAKKLTLEELNQWSDLVYKNCSMCQRCTINCPLGVDIPAIIGAARGTLTSLGLAPEMLDMLANASIAREDLDTFKDIFVEQIKVLESQLKEKTGDPKASIPMDVEGADFLYVPLSGAHTILPAAAIFNKADESWTMSMFEASNYGVFLQDAKRSKQIIDRIVKEAIRLKVKEVIITECGHAFATFRWVAPSWYKEPWPFKVRSLIEVMDEYIQKGKIKVDKNVIKDALTLHDSCNLGRSSGLFEEPRRILEAISKDFREMTPNRERNYCCGGGAGLVAVPEWEDTRMKAGKAKAEQIKKTGAKIVVASCDNCRHQIQELSTHYDLDVEISGLSELLIKAIV
jgi:Fe-S oxidoreductase